MLMTKLSLGVAIVLIVAAIFYFGRRPKQAAGHAKQRIRLNDLNGLFTEPDRIRVYRNCSLQRSDPGWLVFEAVDGDAVRFSVGMTGQTPWFRMQFKLLSLQGPTIIIHGETVMSIVWGEDDSITNPDLTDDEHAAILGVLSRLIDRMSAPSQSHEAPADIVPATALG